MFTVRDVLYGRSEVEQDIAKPVVNDLHSGIAPGILNEASHMTNVPAIPTIKVQYCQSCGYFQAFQEISKMLKHNYPEIKVEGEVHKPNFIRSAIINLLFIAKIGVLAMIYMNFNPFTYFNLPTPGIWTYLMQSKISSSLMVLFLCNTIEGNLGSTGAFEIFYNDIPVWSKIQTGRMPSAPELLSIIQSQYSFVRNSARGEFREL